MTVAGRFTGSQGLSPDCDRSNVVELCWVLLTSVQGLGHSDGHAPVAQRRRRPRWRLQPRAVAARGLARGRRADAAGRRHLRHRGGLLLVVARAGARPLRVRLARRGARPAPRRRRRGRPRHRDRLSPTVVQPQVPRLAAGAQRRHPPVARQPAGVLPELDGVHRARRRARRADGPPLPRPPGAGDVARLERVRLPQPALLVRRLRRGLPRVADGPPRRPRRAQRGLGHRVLEPALHGVGAGDPAAGHPDLPQPDAVAGLLAVRLGHPAGAVRGRARRPARAVARGAGHHELHDQRPLPAARLRALGARGRRRQHRPLRRAAAPGRGARTPGTTRAASSRSPPTSPAASPAASRGC